MRLLGQGGARTSSWGVGGGVGRRARGATSTFMGAVLVGSWQAAACVAMLAKDSEASGHTRIYVTIFGCRENRTQPRTGASSVCMQTVTNAFCLQQTPPPPSRLHVFFLFTTLAGWDGSTRCSWFWQIEWMRSRSTPSKWIGLACLRSLRRGDVLSFAVCSYGL